MGHRQYLTSLDAGRQEFLLRRNIPMIEKGLTVRPRRQTFAVSYINETAEIFGRPRSELPDFISSELENRAGEVLV